MSLIIILFVIWDVYWRAHALWLAAKRSEKGWFIALLIVNSIGILPIYYLHKNNYFKKSNQVIQ